MFEYNRNKFSMSTGSVLLFLVVCLQVLPLSDLQSHYDTVF